MGPLAAILLQLGGPVLAKIIERKFGGESGELTQAGLDALGKAFRVEPDPAVLEQTITTQAKADADVTAAKVKLAEADIAAQLLAYAEVMKAGNDQQRQTNELLLEQMKQPGWRSDWLYAWQWFLLASWAWRIIIMPIGAAMVSVTGGPVDALQLPVDLGTHLTLTGLYLGLHMGGHTVLELVRNQWGGLFGKKDQAS